MANLVITTPTAFATELPTMAISGHFAHIISEKVVSLKKGNEGMTVMVRRENTVQLGTDYSKVVNNRADKEGVADTVELQGLPDYLERVNKFITKHRTKGSLYLSALPVSAMVTYYLNGEEVKLDTVRSMMYSKDLPHKSSKPKTQGDLDNAVQWRRYSLDNVVQIATKGITFTF